MQVKTFATTLGVGMLTGATMMLMIPKHSCAYKIADETAATIMQGMSHAVDALKQ